MEGSLIDDYCEIESPNRTVVLVGLIGKDKSATANSILQENAFVSKSRPTGVTSICQKQTTMLSDRRILTVIDTPGLFVFSDDKRKEILRCVDMAKDGIHAFLLVLSVTGRYTREEADAIQIVLDIFGNRVSDYMVVVFTGRDHLEDEDLTLEDYLGPDSPEPLKKILQLCENRWVLFDNKTSDKKKKQEQVEQLVSLVDKVVDKNDKKPFTKDMLGEMKNGALKVLDEAEKQAEQKDLKDKFAGLKNEALKVLDEAEKQAEQKDSKDEFGGLKNEALKVLDEAEKQAEKKVTNEEFAGLKNEALKVDGSEEGEERSMEDKITEFCTVCGISMMGVWILYNFCCEFARAVFRS